MACAFPESMEENNEDDDTNPYTPEVQNGIRVAALLVNEGTKAVRKRFMAKLKESNFKSVAEALQDKSIKRKMDALHKKKVLNDAQYKLLFPKSGKPNWNDFDLTLLSLLFRNMINLPPPISTRNWNDSPDPTDTGFSADLVRIRKFRNEIYGHISHIGLPDQEFTVLWTDIETVLLRLDSNKKHIDKLKEMPLSSTSRDDYFRKMIVLLENDVLEMRALVEVMTKSMSKDKEFYQDHLKNIEEVVNNLAQQCSSDFQSLDFRTAEVLQLLENLPGEITKTILQNIHSGNFDVVKAVTEMRSEIKTMLDGQSSQLQDLKHTVIEGVENVKGDTERILDAQQQNAVILDKISILCQNIDVKENENLHMIHHRMKQTSSAFRVLLFNKPTALQTTFQHVKNEFCYALGSVPWDIVIDLDHDSRSDSGIFDNIASVLSKKKDYKVVTYEELTNLTEDDRENIANNVKTLWILGNGCSYIGCSSTENKIGVLVSKLFSLFESILRKLQAPRALVFFNVIMSKTMQLPMSHIVQNFSFACQASMERIHYDESCRLSVYLEETQASYVPRCDSDIKNFQSKVTPSELIFVLADCFPFEHLDKTFSYPGKRTQCFISTEDMAQLKPYAELYHKDIGQINFDGKTEEEIEKIVDDIKHKFLKGHMLSPEAMFVHHNCNQVYVTRQEMKEVKAIIEKSLEEKEQWRAHEDRVYQGKYEILHDASGSGTTTGIYLLYSLRSTYPCLSVKKITDKTVEFLKKISRESEKPILLVVDNAEYKSSDVSSLLYEMQNKQIKSLIVHVRRLASSDEDFRTDQYCGPMNTKCYMSSKLHYLPDKVSFRKLYEDVQRKITADRVYLFGLIAFCEDYARLDTHVRACLEGMTSDEISALLLVFTIRKFCQSSVRVSLLCNLLKKKKVPTATLR